MVVIALLLVINSIPIYFDKYSYEIVNYKKINVVFFGDSHSEYGFNDKSISARLKKDVRNISLSGNSIINTTLLVKKFIELNPKAQINISIGMHNIEETYFLNGQELDIEFSRWFSKYDLNEIFSLFRSYPLNSLKGFFGIISQINIETYGYSESISRLHQLKSKNTGSSRTNIDMNWEKFYWIQKLESIIRDNPKTNFKILRVPIHESIFQEDSTYLRVVNHFVQFENVEFQEYQGIPLKDEDFRDFSHLSSEGANKLSKEFYLRNK